VTAGAFSALPQDKRANQEERYALGLKTLRRLLQG